MRAQGAAAQPRTADHGTRKILALGVCILLKGGSMDEPPATRHSLIVKLRDPADGAAWGEFVALYEPLIYRLARRKGLQDADARDLCQAVFRAVAQAID